MSSENAPFERRNSSHAPCSTIFPSRSTITSSHLDKRPSWLVTSTTVLPRPLKRCRMQASNSFFPTCASTAASTSSSNSTSGSAYTLRARPTRAFCPPDRLIPFSPISVLSPAGSVSKSGPRQQHSMTSRYLPSLKAFPNTTFSLRVAFMIHGCCAAYPTAPHTTGGIGASAHEDAAAAPTGTSGPPVTGSEVLVGVGVGSISFSSAASKLVLPLPTLPVTASSVPGFTSNPASSRHHGEDGEDDDVWGKGKGGDAGEGDEVPPAPPSLSLSIARGAGEDSVAAAVGAGVAH
mmetsp:Transcript_42270/g.85534  ORF Transcript_42270/g.85534 Transcript_42270/m.85534 type:complete len:292 (-) Transcript_42270:1615-2490(-)